MIKNSPGFASVSKQSLNRYSSFTHWLSVICYSWLPLYTQELPTVILDTQKRFPLFGTKKKATGSFLNPRNTHKLSTSFSPSAVEVIFPSYTSKRTLASHSNAFNASPLNYCHYAPSTVVSAEATLFYQTAILVSYKKLLFICADLVDNCIGIKNRRHYLLFLFYTTILYCLSLYPLDLISDSLQQHESPS